jgi:hypothetical protein
MFGALKVVAPFESIKGRIVLVPVSKFDYVLMHAGFMGSHKFNSIDGH